MLGARLRMAVGTHALRLGGRSLSFKGFPGPFPSPFTVVRLVPPFPFPPSSGAYGDSLHFSPALRQVGNEGLGPPPLPAAPGSHAGQPQPFGASRRPPRVRRLSTPPRPNRDALPPHQRRPRGHGGSAAPSLRGHRAQGRWWDGEGSRASPAGDVPNAGQSRSPGAPEAVGTPLPWQGLPVGTGTGTGQLQGHSPARGVGIPLAALGAWTPPGAWRPPGTWAPQSLVLIFWLFQTFAGSGEQRSPGKGPEPVPLPAPSALRTLSPPSPPAHGCPVPDQSGRRVPRSPQFGLGWLRPVPWEEPARDGRVSFGLAVGRVDNEELL